MSIIKFSRSYAGHKSKPALKNEQAPFGYSMKEVDLRVQNRRLLMILLGVLAALVMITVVTVLVRN